MSDAEHRRIAALLGFPSCCTECWIADSQAAAIRRGYIVAHARRTIFERVRLSKLLNWPLDWIGQHAEYVACWGCMGGPGWHPYDA